MYKFQNLTPISGRFRTNFKISRISGQCPGLIIIFIPQVISGADLSAIKSEIASCHTLAHRRWGLMTKRIQLLLRNSHCIFMSCSYEWAFHPCCCRQWVPLFTEVARRIHCWQLHKRWWTRPTNGFFAASWTTSIIHCMPCCCRSKDRRTTTNSDGVFTTGFFHNTMETWLTKTSLRDYSTKTSINSQCIRLLFLLL